jgi:hypothetical protein
VQITQICTSRSATPDGRDLRQNGGYRVSRNRGAVTFGNEAAVWPSPTPGQRYDDVIGDFSV